MANADVKKVQEVVKKNANAFWPLMKLQPWRFGVYTLVIFAIGYVFGKM